MRLITGLTLLLCLGSGLAHADDIKRLRDGDTGEYQAKDGGKLIYALTEPTAAKTDKKYPLVVFLHGAGGMSGERKADRGKDGANQFFQTVTEDCYFFLPQASEVWAGIDWGNAPYKMNDKPTNQMKQVIECVEWLIKNKAIDPDRVYVAGTSMGSMGMWDLVCRRPDLFAAGVACCGGFDADQAKKIKHIPFRIFHGDKDPWVPYDGSKAMFDALKNADADVDLKTYKGSDHFIWQPTFTDKALLNWLFEQKRKRTTHD
jgi:predicted peptidase